ncbi:double-strand break repair protein AddB [Methylocella sp. CPCC 101449]|uniref:double-strand break repair protein AddB n=1 Tax=Methylocella sp. CPCC 101449 TaxID=2987531 RepID=UPI002891FEBC|nr:double-strand break repair protein AddB [Methylocella sp. CPCC 101449]MDT2019853.1 double-strand break repair protein AddB [Methylocella sp. CPCC 101449]
MSERAASHRRRLFTIPASAPFLATFAQVLLDGAIIPGFPDRGDPLALSTATIYVPTRRAARALTAELTRLVTEPAIFLPRILPLGALDDFETGQIFTAESEAYDPDLPEAIGELDRRLALTRLIEAWSARITHAIVTMSDGGEPQMDGDEPFVVAATPSHAFALACELAGVIDEFRIQGVALDDLQKLVPDDFDRYWKITLDFLKIAFEYWPAYLDEQGWLDRVERQARLIERRVGELKRAGSPGPQIVLGSTGTNRATADLINAIAQLANGAVILPGLDLTMDEKAWSEVGEGVAEGHPQTALKHLLGRLEASREDVAVLTTTAPAAREKFIGEALLPAQVTGAWQNWRAKFDAAAITAMLTDISLIDAADDGEEARAIAVGLRHVLETPGRTAALITPDRTIAQRVRAELARWDIEVDDSGGDPLASMPQGVLARLLLVCAQANPLPSDWIALLSHPHLRLGFTAQDMARIARQAEIALLRGRSFHIDEIEAALSLARHAAMDRHAHPALKALTETDWQDIEAVLRRLAQAVRPLAQVPTGDLAAWAQAHRQAFEALRAGDTVLFPGDDGETLQHVFETMQVSTAAGLSFTHTDYAGVFERLAQETIVRGPRRTHPRLKILGLLEARLIPADTVFVAGLDEGVWPPQARTDAFLNRPMRKALGLNAPERRIGQTAHDFVMALGAEEVWLSRASKRGGSPTIASRFLQRMEALAGPEAWEACRGRGEELLHYARALDRAPDKSQPVSQPEPKPAIELRPTSLSVTRIETLRRDPYSIYAERILKVQPLDEAGEEDGARLTGTLTHNVLARFQQANPDPALPPDAEARLMAIAQAEFAALLNDANFVAFTWPRIEAQLRAFLAWDLDERADVTRLLIEERGRLAMPLADGSQFNLTAEADRIERRGEEFRIVDFKTGVLPTHKLIEAGFAVQVTLEAAMLQRGAFTEAPAGSAVSGAAYVKFHATKADEVREVGSDRKGKPLSDLIAEHHANLVIMLGDFRKPSTGYRSRPYPQYRLRFGTYDHLARVREWSFGSGPEEIGP